jgi:hypothetical protein
MFLIGGTVFFLMFFTPLLIPLCTEREWPMPFAIYGDWDIHQDTLITVESYDDGITLMTVTVDGRTYAIELSEHSALKLSEHLAKGRWTMSHTFDAATFDRITGRLVGDLSEHIAVTVVGDTTRDEVTSEGYLLAVSIDGTKYVTWRYNTMNDSVVTYWGHYFIVSQYPSAYDAFMAASQDLAKRAHK